MNNLLKKLELLSVDDSIQGISGGPINSMDISSRANLFVNNLKRLYANRDSLVGHITQNVQASMRDIESLRSALEIQARQIGMVQKLTTATDFSYENFVDKSSFAENSSLYRGYRTAHLDSVGNTIGPALDRSISCVRYNDRTLASATVIRECGGFQNHTYGLQNILDGDPYTTWFTEASSTHPIDVVPSWSPSDTNGNAKIVNGGALVLDINFFQSRIFNTISIDPIATTPFFIVGMEGISEDGAVDSLMDDDEHIYLDGPISISLPWGKTIAGMHQHNTSDRSIRSAKLRLYLYQPYYTLLGNNIAQSDKGLSEFLQLLMHPSNLSDILSAYDENYPGYTLYTSILSDVFDIIGSTHTNDKPDIKKAVEYAIDKYIDSQVNELFHLRYSIGIKDIDVVQNYYADHGLYISNKLDIDNNPRRIDIDLEYSAHDGILYDKFDVPEFVMAHNNFLGQVQYFSKALAQFSVVIDEDMIAQMNTGAASDVNYTSDIIEAYLSVNDNYSWEDFPIRLGRPIYLYSLESANPTNALYMAAMSHDSTGRQLPSNSNFSSTHIAEEYQPYMWRFYPDTGTASSTGGIFYSVAKRERFVGNMYNNLTYDDFVITARIQASGSGETIDYTSATSGVSSGPRLPYIACHFYTTSMPQYATAAGFVMGVDISGTAFLMRGGNSYSFLENIETGLDMSSAIRQVHFSCLDNRASIYIDGTRYFNYALQDYEPTYGSITEQDIPTSGKIRTTIECYSGIHDSSSANGFLSFYMYQYAISYPDVNVLTAPYIPNKYTETFNVSEINNNAVRLGRTPYVDLAMIEHSTLFNPNVGFSSGTPHPMSIRFIEGNDIIMQDQNSEEYYLPTTTVVVPAHDKQIFTRITDKIFQSPHDKWDGDKVWLDLVIELLDSDGNPGIVTDLPPTNISSGGYNSNAAISYGSGMTDYIVMPHLSQNYRIDFDQGQIEFTDTFMDAISGVASTYGAYTHLSYMTKSIDRRTPYIWNITDYRSSTQRSLQTFDIDTYPVYEFINIDNHIKFNNLPSQGTIEVTYGSLAPDIRLVLKLKNSGSPPFISAYSVVSKSESI